MSESNQNVDRWRELADLLGLPPEESAAETSSKPKPTPARAVQETPAWNERAPEKSAASAGFEEAQDHDLMAGRHVSDDMEADDFPAEVAPDDEPFSKEPQEWIGAAEIEDEILVETKEEDQPGTEAPPGAEPGVEDDRPRRGRRRGRRGRKGRDDERPAPTGQQPARTPGAEADEDGPPIARREAGRNDRGGRGRGAPRRPTEMEPEPQEDRIDAAQDVEDHSPRRGHDDDDSEVDRLKDWNVPSWNDLIGSLYRPDR